MPFNSKSSGYQNETDFINNLNNKKIKNLSYNLQLFIKDLYENTNSESEVISYKDYKKKKFDIIIKIDNRIKRISIKKGIKNSVHSEPISEMIHFLIKNKMPKHMTINFLKYHYADGSTNGTGNDRISADDYKKKYQDEIDEINIFLNKKEILKKAIDRFVINGRNSIYKIDAILYGVPNDFIWIKRDDIYKILLTKINEYSTSIHFSHLTYQPMNRCLNHNPKYEKCRFISQIKWYNISDDIIENMNNNAISSTISGVVQ